MSPMEAANRVWKELSNLSVPPTQVKVLSSYPNKHGQTLATHGVTGQVDGTTVEMQVRPSAATEHELHLAVKRAGRLSGVHVEFHNNVLEFFQAERVWDFDKSHKVRSAADVYDGLG